MGFRNPIVGGTNAGDTTGSRELVIPGITSDDYVEATQGWRIGEDGQAQFENINVLDTVGADTLTADTIQIGTADLMADLLNPLPLGLIAFGSAASGIATAQIGNVETALFTFNVGSLYGARYYKMHFRFHWQATVAGDSFDFRIRYTIDGSTPSVGNSVFASGCHRVNAGNPTASTDVDFTIYYTPSGDHDTVQFVLTAVRAAGSGTGNIYQNTLERALVWTMEDVGLQSNVGGTIAQVSKASGTPDPPPTATYTKTFNATWSRSYDSDGGTRTGDDTTHCYQGYYSGTHGNTRSLIGFDYASIMSALSGATVNSVKLTFRVLHTFENSGAPIQIGGHNYTSKPSTWNGGNVAEQQTSKSGIAGSTYTITLPSSFGTNFKSGAWKGIAIGPGPSNSQLYYAYLAGYGDSGAPKLTITYTK